MGNGECSSRHAGGLQNGVAGSRPPEHAMAPTRDDRDGRGDGKRLESLDQGWTGIVRFPSTIDGKSFTSSYASVMNRSLLCCVSPSVVLSYGAVRFAASTSFKDLPCSRKAFTFAMMSTSIAR